MKRNSSLSVALLGVLCFCMLGARADGVTTLRSLQEDEEQDQQMYDDAYESDGYGSTIKYERCFQDNSGKDVVFFMMCPVQSGCASQCYAGKEYIANIDVFVEKFLQAQLGEFVDEENEEAAADNDACEEAKQACADDDECDEEEEDMDECNGQQANYEQADKEFQLQRYAHCTSFGDYYVGPYCQDYGIYLGFFVDGSCTQLLDDEVYANIYGSDLQYSVTSGISIVGETCASCDGDLDGYQFQGGKTYDVSRCEYLFNNGGTAWEDIIEPSRGAGAKNALIIGLVLLAVAGVVFGIGSLAYFVGFRLGPDMFRKKTSLLQFETNPEPE